MAGARIYMHFLSHLKGEQLPVWPTYIHETVHSGAPLSPISDQPRQRPRPRPRKPEAVELRFDSRSRSRRRLLCGGWATCVWSVFRVEKR